jgi:iron complex outermembrane receptor protein
LLAYELGYRTQPFPVVSLAVATFYNVYDRLRSTERVNPPAPLPIMLANGQDGRSYGVELTADYQVTNGWRLRAGYAGLHIRIRPKPGSTDVSMGASEARDPSHQVQVRSFLDLPGRLGFDGGLRYVTRIVNQDVPAYAELNVRMSWRPDPRLQLAIVGQNLLHDHHAEFGAGTARREIRRSVFGSVTWQF